MLSDYCLIALVAIISSTTGQECVQGDNCKLPNCFCPTYDHFLGAENIPQIVYFGFDDAVQPQVSGYYQQIFTKDKLNPNGCPITMSLYISHEYTVYSLVSEYFKRGDEAAVHSVTHTDIDTAAKLLKEATEQKENIEKLANIPANDIIGWRSPNLKTAGDDQPRVLKELNYTYDISLTYDRDTNYPFPFTLDYGNPYPCVIPSCPTTKHEGFWEVMVHSLTDPKTGTPCAYVDSCRPDGEDAALEYLWTNFLTTYENKRAPFGLNMHAAWFAFPGIIEATNRFIDRLLDTPDVYIVNVKQMMKWMQNPVNLTEIKNYEPWGCEQSFKTPSPTPAKSQGKTQNPEKETTRLQPTMKSAMPVLNWFQRYRTFSPTTRAPTTKPITTTMNHRTDNNDKSLLWQSNLKRGTNLLQRTPTSQCVQGVNCKLPSCLCKTINPPYGIHAEDIPQIIYLAIESQIDGNTFSSLMQLFSGSLRNPNGCPITGTIFMPPTGNYPPYIEVLKQSGAHISLRSRSYSDFMSRELVRLNINRDLSRNDGQLSPQFGWRALGYLSPSDSVLKTLHDNDVAFDSSVINNSSTHSTWPYTLDFGIQSTCSNTSSMFCPQYPGMWEVPLERILIPGTTETCMYMDSCSTHYSTEQLLLHNFIRHYDNGKIPLGINIGNQWLLNNGRQGLRELSRFIETVLRTRNVMVISIDRMLQWITSPSKSMETMSSC